MALPSRLSAIASYIPPGVRVADIGTENAKLPLFLASTGKYRKIIATELNEKPYLNACRQVAESGLGEIVEVRKGSGLETINAGEVDLAVIAGMGGNTIITILENSPEKLAGISTLVLQPMSGAGLLRTWLARHDWLPEDEEVVKEGGKFYNIIVAKPGKERCCDPLLLEIGPVLLKKTGPVLLEYLQKREKEYRQIQKGLAKSKSGRLAAKAAEVDARLVKLREVIKHCRQNV